MNIKIQYYYFIYKDEHNHSFSIKNREFLLKVVCKRKINSTPPFALFVTFFQPCVQCCCLDLIEEHSMKKMLMKKCFLSFSFSRLCLFTSHWIELIFPNLLRKMKVVFISIKFNFHFNMYNLHT